MASNVIDLRVIVGIRTPMVHSVAVAVHDEPSVPGAVEGSARGS